MRDVCVQNKPCVFEPICAEMREEGHPAIAVVPNLGRVDADPARKATVRDPTLQILHLRQCPDMKIALWLIIRCGGMNNADGGQCVVCEVQEFRKRGNVSRFALARVQFFWTPTIDQ